MADASEYRQIDDLINEIRSDDEIEGRDKQFLTRILKIQDRASKMLPGKVRAYRGRLAKACGGNDALVILASLWMETCMGEKDFCVDGSGPTQRINIKNLASCAGIDKRDAHAILFLVAQSLPGLNGGSCDVTRAIQ